MAYRPKLAVLGFPMGYYYMHAGEEAACLDVARFALSRAGIRCEVSKQ